MKPDMKTGTRTWIACVIVALSLAIPAVACTDGTTPDCSSPDAACSPDLSGSLEAGEGGEDVEASPVQDTGTVDSSHPNVDSGDASPDAADARG